VGGKKEKSPKRGRRKRRLFVVENPSSPSYLQDSNGLNMKKKERWGKGREFSR